MKEAILLERLSEHELYNPALFVHARQRKQGIDNRIADRITQFAGSMAFVWIHVIWFGVRIGSGLERPPSKEHRSSKQNSSADSTTRSRRGRCRA
jgi:uncharacterized membrane protein